MVLNKQHRAHQSEQRLTCMQKTCMANMSINWLPWDSVSTFLYTILRNVVIAVLQEKNNNGNNLNQFHCLYVKDFVEMNLLSDTDKQEISKCEIQWRTVLFTVLHIPACKLNFWHPLLFSFHTHFHAYYGFSLPESTIPQKPTAPTKCNMTTSCKPRIMQWALCFCCALLASFARCQTLHLLPLFSRL